MNFYVINLFHLSAVELCKYILEQGYQVYGVGINQLENFTTFEEDLWMAFGRNANFSYVHADVFLVQKEIKQDAEIFYFPFQQEVRNEHFLSVFNQLENLIYYVQDNPSEDVQKLCPSINFLTDDEEFLKKFFLERI